MVCAQTRICHEECDTQNPLGFWDTSRTFNLARRPGWVITKKKKKENLPNSRLCCPGQPQRENQRKEKERQVLRLCQRTKKSGGTWERRGY